jgi:hypothetical protein
MNAVPPTAQNGVGSHHLITNMSIRSSELVKLGELAAETFNEKETAQTALDESFGLPFEASRDNLLRDIQIAESEGLDLSVFSGAESRFKFPIYNTNIVVRISKIPTPHEKLEKLQTKVAKLEQELKLAKMALKHTAEQLVAAHECDELTDRISLAFTRLRKG